MENDTHLTKLLWILSSYEKQQDTVHCAYCVLGTKYMYTVTAVSNFSLCWNKIEAAKLCNHAH